MKTKLKLAVIVAGLTGVISANAGDVTGKISFSDANGPAPEPITINFAADPKCGNLHEGPAFVTIYNVSEDGGLGDVLVYVKEGLGDQEFPAPEKPILLDQIDCIYTPYISSIQIGQKFTAKNSDDILHNVFIPEIQLNQIQIDSSAELAEVVFDKEYRFLRVSCSFHPWMIGYINVVDNPFHTISKEDGTFEIKGLPAGEYVIEAHHRRLGKQEMKVTVGDDDGATADFSFAMPEEE